MARGKRLGWGRGGKGREEGLGEEREKLPPTPTIAEAGGDGGSRLGFC